MVCVYGFAKSLFPTIMLLLDGGSTSPGTFPNDPELEAAMAQKLELYNVDTDFTFFTEATSGQQFTYSISASTVSATYESAATSKWVTAVIVL